MWLKAHKKHAAIKTLHLIGSDNERQCYISTSFLIGWAHTQNDPWIHVHWCSKSSYASAVDLDDFFFKSDISKICTLSKWYCCDCTNWCGKVLYVDCCPAGKWKVHIFSTLIWLTLANALSESTGVYSYWYVYIDAWLSARLQSLHCVTNGVTTVLHKANTCNMFNSLAPGRFQ